MTATRCVSSGVHPSAALVRADALSIPLCDDSVDLVVTSPPYFALRSYSDDGEHYDGQIGSEPSPQAFLEALWAVTAECWRVLKPSGSLFVNLGDKYAGSGGGNQGGVLAHRNPALEAVHDHRVNAMSAPRRYNQESDGIRQKSLMGLPWRYAIGCIDGQADPDHKGWVLRSEIVWSKPNGLPESVTDRVRRSHEQWFHFTKEGRYYSAVDELREPHEHPKAIEYRLRKGAPTKGNKTNTDRGDLGAANFGGNPLGKLPGSVWTVPTEPLIVPEWVGVDHFAAFPTEWPRRLILGWSPPGVCVECGEGRRPTTATEREGVSVRGGASTRIDGGGKNRGGYDAPGAETWQRNLVTVTGYACACPEPTAPTRPAVVLDPFGGTGTTAMVARSLGRFGVSLDLSADYLRLAKWRVFHSGHGAKAVQRTMRERQGSLL